MIKSLSVIVSVLGTGLWSASIRNGFMLKVILNLGDSEYFEFGIWFQNRLESTHFEPFPSLTII
jgi:hypothetical protein